MTSMIQQFYFNMNTDIQQWGQCQLWRGGGVGKGWGGEKLTNLSIHYVTRWKFDEKESQLNSIQCIFTYLYKLMLSLYWNIMQYFFIIWFNQMVFILNT